MKGVSFSLENALIKRTLPLLLDKSPMTVIRLHEVGILKVLKRNKYWKERPSKYFTSKVRRVEVF